MNPKFYVQRNQDETERITGFIYEILKFDIIRSLALMWYRKNMFY